jgi:TRAP-type C4-dicarboxylate transport system substrate-binding protein
MSTQAEMTEEDKKIVASFIDEYANTGKKPTPEVLAQAEELMKKYNIKINRNPRPIKSRFARRIHDSGDGPYVRTEPKADSKGTRKKLQAKLRKEANKARH